MGCLASVNGLFTVTAVRQTRSSVVPIAGREHAGLSGQLGFMRTRLLFEPFTGEEDFLGLLSHVRSVCLALCAPLILLAFS
ncbi:hypothetical protein ACI06P_02050 [Sphingobacterium sp. ML3W]|uniref:hypothetical protein n=1 Tax=Sphingobacterium sp. ML3W TaxID=1538644 RepID=UPI00384F689F